MKTQEEIKQLAEKYATSIYGFSNENYNDYYTDITTDNFILLDDPNK